MSEISRCCSAVPGVVMKLDGINVHLGYAKGKLVNSVKIAAAIIDKLPKDSLSPETTQKREGYVHPHNIQGGVEITTLKFFIRDFTVEGLNQKKQFLQRLAQGVADKYPKAKLDFKVEESYRNIKYKLDEDPKVVNYASKAVKRTGLEPKLNIIRGGTDGARLSYQGLLTANIFIGGHGLHSKLE